MIHHMSKGGLFSAFSPHRAAALRQLGIGESGLNPALSDIAQLAAELLGCPMAAVTFVADGHQWFKGAVGGIFPSVALGDSICVQALRGREAVGIGDLSGHVGFKDKPFVANEPHVRFYAAAPLWSEDGVALGSLCVFDTAPRIDPLPDTKARSLLALARLVTRELTAKRPALAGPPHRLETPAPARPDGETPDTWRTPFADGLNDVRYRLKHHSGDYRWVSSRVQPLRNDRGQVERWIGTSVDIDAIAEAESALSTSQEFAERLLASFDGCVMVFDLDGRLLFMNERGQQAMGVDDRSDTGGSSWLDLWADAARETAAAAFERAKSGRSDRFEAQDAGRSETSKWWDVTVTPIMNSERKPETCLAIARDSSKFLESEQDLRLNSDRYRALVKASMAIVWRADSKGVLLESPGWQEFTGQTPEEFQRNGWLDAVHPDDRDRVTQAWRNLIRSEELGRAECRVLLPNGDYRWVLVTGMPLINLRGDVQEWIGTLTDIHEQKAAAEHLRMSEQRYRALIETSTAIVWRADADGLYIEGWGWREFCGHEPMVGAPLGWLDLIHPGDRHDTASAWQEAVAGKTAAKITHRMLGPAGEYRWVYCRALPLLDETGTVQEWTGTIADIHDRRSAEDKLRASEERLRLAVETTGLGIWDFDLVTGQHQWTPEAYHLLGLAPDGPIHTSTILKLVHPLDRDRLETIFHAGRTKGALAYSETFRFLRADTGEERWLTVTGRTVLDHDGKPVRKIGTAQDITARKLAEIALKTSKDKLSRSEAHLRSILETVPDAMIVSDEKGMIRSFSATAEQIFGYRPEEVIGTNVQSLMHGASRERHDDFIRHHRDSGERRLITPGRIATAQRKDGTSFPMEVQVGAMEWDGERYFTAFIRDLTERQNTEMRMQELQAELAYMSRLTAMGEMGSTLAHEINQPLTAITSYLKGCGLILDRMEGEQVAMLRLAVDEAAEEALRAGEVIRQLREFVARGESEHRIEDLQRLVEEAGALGLVGAKEKGVQVEFHFPPDSPQVIVNRVQIQQVLINLLRNAIEAMHDTPDPFLAIGARVVQDGAMVQISVRDTGPGIPAEILSKLFTPFTTTKKSGMGVGLSICRTIVESHGGKIWADSDPGTGTTFHFTLRNVDLEEVSSPEA